MEKPVRNGGDGNSVVMKKRKLSSLDQALLIWVGKPFIKT